MEVLACGKEVAHVHLTADELRFLRNATNEVCNGVTIADFEFEARLGYGRRDGALVIDGLDSALGACIGADAEDLRRLSAVSTQRALHGQTPERLLARGPPRRAVGPPKGAFRQDARRRRDRRHPPRRDGDHRRSAPRRDDEDGDRGRAPRGRTQSAARRAGLPPAARPGIGQPWPM
jgi:hypothetical protein